MKKISIPFVVATIMLFSCSKDAEPETMIDANSLELNYNKQHQFEINKGSENISSAYKWASSDPTVGTISQTGKFIARKIGPTVVSAKSGDQEFLSYITVSPYSTMFKEPIFDFGQDKATIKKNNIGIVDAESDNLLVYPVYTQNVKRLIYAFEYENLVGVAVDISDTEEAKKEAKTFFRERYPNVLPINGTQDSIYINDGKNIGVKFSNNESLGFYATYGKVTFTNGRIIEKASAANAILKSMK